MPKRLEEPPVLYELSTTRSERPRAGIRSGTSGSAQGVRTSQGESDEPGRLLAERLGEPNADPAALEQARRIAARLALPRPRRQRVARRTSGDMRSVPYRGESDDIDLDRTVEVLAERRIIDESDIVVREPARTRRAVVLAVDVSGSMRGERLRMAAATVGALAGELRRDELGVIAFWSDALVLSSLAERPDPLELVNAIMNVPARGLTNVGFALEAAGRMLGGQPGREERVVLLSDCVHNAGPDPRHAAGTLGRVDLLVDVTGEHDLELGRLLARTGRGRCLAVRHHRDVAPALHRLFASGPA